MVKCHLEDGRNQLKRSFPNWILTATELTREAACSHERAYTPLGVEETLSVSHLLHHALSFFYVSQCQI